MSPVWTTFLTSLISTYAIPILEKKYNVHLATPEQQAALTAGAVGAVTAAAHWTHLKLSPRHRR